MKKILNLLLVFIMLVGLMGNINAANIGDIVNSTLYTDIVAKINGHDIASYNIDGYTVVVAEDLRNYGFNVVWSEYDRSLYITKNESATYVTSTYIAPFVPKTQVGEKADFVLYTDIKTYMDGNLVTSFNIGGRTVVYFNDLQRYGGVSYDDNARVLSVVLPWLAAPAGSTVTAGTTTTTTTTTSGSAYSRLTSGIKAKGKRSSDENGVYYYLSDEFNLDSGDVSFYVSYNPDEFTGFLIDNVSDGVKLTFIIIVDDINGAPKGASFTASDGANELSVSFTYDRYGSLVVASSDNHELSDLAKDSMKVTYEMIDVYLEENGINVTMKDLGFYY